MLTLPLPAAEIFLQWVDIPGQFVVIDCHMIFDASAMIDHGSTTL
jgi:hypothetical protein